MPLVALSVFPAPLVPDTTGSTVFAGTEACATDANALPEVRQAERYGHTGEDQGGIEVVADLHDGRAR